MLMKNENPNICGTGGYRVKLQVAFEGHNCNIELRKGLHTSKPVRNDILHLIIGFFC